MKIFNSPGQARALREVEAAVYASTQTIRDVNADIQPIPSPEEVEKEAEGAEAPKKARSKKKTESV